MAKVFLLLVIAVVVLASSGGFHGPFEVGAGAVCITGVTLLLAGLSRFGRGAIASLSTRPAARPRPPGSPYRLPDAEQPADAGRVGAPVAHRHRGPRASCPACGARNAARCPSCHVDVAIDLLEAAGKCPQDQWTRQRLERVTAGTFCGRPAQVERGWVVKLGTLVIDLFVGRCAEPVEHLHQRCQVCGASWICAPIEQKKDECHEL